MHFPVIFFKNSNTCRTIKKTRNIYTPIIQYPFFFYKGKAQFEAPSIPINLSFINNMDIQSIQYIMNLSSGEISKFKKSFYIVFLLTCYNEIKLIQHIKKIIIKKSILALTRRT